VNIVSICLEKNLYRKNLYVKKYTFVTFNLTHYRVSHTQPFFSTGDICIYVHSRV